MSSFKPTTEAHLYDPINHEKQMATHIPNFGLLSGKIPDDLFSKVEDEVNTIYSDFNNSSFYGHKLAGNIKNEYGLNKCKKDLENFMVNQALEYDKAFDYGHQIKIADKDMPYIMKESWVNFQAKHEFNPFHTHTGIYSFVLFVDIPYTEEDMSKSPGAKSNSNCAGALSFYYTDILGGMRDFTFKASKKDKQSFIFFPAKLPHSVHPFYEIDTYRITVSGNIIYKND